MYTTVHWLPSQPPECNILVMSLLLMLMLQHSCYVIVIVAVTGVTACVVEH